MYTLMPYVLNIDANLLLLSIIGLSTLYLEPSNKLKNSPSKPK
jgi:hypothetical protein